MSLQFEFFDFVPRKEFEQKANQVLNELRDEIHFDFECEARCTYFANKFFFQIVFRGENSVLSAQTILDPKKEDVSQRGWQLKAIENMSNLLRGQLARFNTTATAA